MADARTPLEEPEMVEILEQIARSGSDTARIQAIKTLRTFRDDDDDQPAEDFEELDELAPRRDRKAS